MEGHPCKGNKLSVGGRIKFEDLEGGGNSLLIEGLVALSLEDWKGLEVMDMSLVEIK